MKIIKKRIFVKKILFLNGIKYYTKKIFSKKFKFFNTMSVET